MTTRTITYNDEGVVRLADGSSQWGSDHQPFAQDRIIIQYRRTPDGYVASEAVLEPTGELIASASHTAFTHDQVRRYLSTRR